MKAFFDTNILVYAFIDDARSIRARALMQIGGSIGVQNLNEFASVARNKMKKDWSWIHEALRTIRSTSAAVVPLDVSLHNHGTDIAERYQLNIYDALILAAALKLRCDVLWSEDMHAGLVVEQMLTIRNPFVANGTR